MVSEKEFLENLGIQIRRLREKYNLSQQNLADMCDLPKSTIGRIERCEMNTSVGMLFKIASALEVPFVVLFEF